MSTAAIAKVRQLIGAALAQPFSDSIRDKLCTRALFACRRPSSALALRRTALRRDGLVVDRVAGMRLVGDACARAIVLITIEHPDAAGREDDRRKGVRKRGGGTR